MQGEVVKVFDGTYELRCPTCQGLVTKLRTDAAEGVALMQAVSVEEYGHRCGMKATGPVKGRRTPLELDDAQWQGLQHVKIRPALEEIWKTARERPSPSHGGRIMPPRPMVVTPEAASGADGILWYSETQKGEWQAQGRAPAFGRLSTGEVVEYTQLFSDRFVDERPAYPDAHCLGPGRFDHVG